MSVECMKHQLNTKKETESGKIAKLWTELADVKDSVNELKMLIGENFKNITELFKK